MQKSVHQIDGQKMRIENQWVEFLFLVVVRECDAVWNFNTELEIIRYWVSILLNNFWFWQYSLVTAKQRPEPLVYFYSFVMAAVFLQIIKWFFLGVNDSLPWVILPWTGSYVEWCWHDDTIRSRDNISKAFCQVVPWSSILWPKVQRIPLQKHNTGKNA